MSNSAEKEGHMSNIIDVAMIGAGTYRLSLAAHLRIAMGAVIRGARQEMS